jgi:hypothetical protein
MWGEALSDTKYSDRLDQFGCQAKVSTSSLAGQSLLDFDRVQA